MSVLVWIVLGMVISAIAKAFLPGDDQGGFVIANVVGIVGALAGGWLSNLLTGTTFGGFSFWSILPAILGAMFLLFLYLKVAVRKSPIW